MNVREAILTEIHVLRHLEMNRPAACHVNLLHYLTIKHSDHTINYPTGIMRGNKSVQLEIYEKGAEMKKKNRSPDQIVPLSPEHQQLLDKLAAGTILRVEWRLRNAEIIRRELAFSIVSDLFFFFEVLDSWLIKKLKSNLFREEVPYDVEDLIGKPPLDRPTSQQRSQFLANIKGGTALAVKQTLLFEALEHRMHTLNRQCMPTLREMHSSSRGSDEFAKFQKELRQIMLWGLSVDGIPNAVLYEELRRAVEAPIGADWTLPAQVPRKPTRRRKVNSTPPELRR